MSHACTVSTCNVLISKITKIDFFVLVGSSDLASARNDYQPPLENPPASESVSKRILNCAEVEIFSIVE